MGEKFACIEVRFTRNEWNITRYRYLAFRNLSSENRDEFLACKVVNFTSAVCHSGVVARTRGKPSVKYRCGFGKILYLIKESSLAWWMWLCLFYLFRGSYRICTRFGKHLLIYFFSRHWQAKYSPSFLYSKRETALKFFLPRFELPEKNLLRYRSLNIWISNG